MLVVMHLFLVTSQTVSLNSLM